MKTLQSSVRATGLYRTNQYRPVVIENSSNRMR